MSALPAIGAAALSGFAVYTLLSSKLAKMSEKLSVLEQAKSAPADTKAKPAEAKKDPAAGWPAVPGQSGDKPAREPKAPRISATNCLELLLPDSVSAAGIAYGGVIMSWIDIAGGITAFKHAGGPVVTASVDQIHFLGPARLGEVITMRGKVLRSFSTSIEVRVVVEAEHLTSGAHRRICDALLVFVALGSDFKPTEVVQCAPETEQEKIDYEESGKRRELRAAWRAEQKVIHQRVDEKKLSDAELGLDPLQPKKSAAPKSDADKQAAAAARKAGESKSDSKSSASGSASKALVAKGSSVPRSISVPGNVAMHTTQVEMTEAVLPPHSNSMGITFGGQVMKWMELAGSIAAQRHSRSVCLTASVDEMSFVKSSKVGDLLIFRAQVNRVFNTSMEVGVRVEAHTRGSSTPVHCNSGYITFIALDERSLRKLKESTDSATSPAPSRVRIKQVVPVRDVDKKRWLLAGERRKRRLNFRASAVAAAQAREQEQAEQAQKEADEADADMGDSAEFELDS